MTFAKILLLLITVVTFGSIASAQVPAAQPAAPAKIGLINSGKFSDTTGGITRLVNAVRTVDAEFKPRRDEIAQLVARFNTLQQVPPNTPPAQLTTRREQAEMLQIEIQRKQEDARSAYARRMSTMTDPIRLSVLNSLEAFAKQRGIDVLLDISKFPDGLLLVNPGAELTSAFIRDFNSKNP
jgi:Skp family chaperone for outer membrane proteins